jgi:hypothetical protein
MYWLLGCFIPDIHTAAHIMGIYKCVQSAGAALAWGLDVSGVDNLVQVLCLPAHVARLLFHGVHSFAPWGWGGERGERWRAWAFGSAWMMRCFIIPCMPAFVSSWLGNKGCMLGAR